MRTKTLWLREEYLAVILAGHKTIEVLVAYVNIARLQVGDRLLLNDRYPYVVHRIDRYRGFRNCCLTRTRAPSHRTWRQRTC